MIHFFGDSWTAGCELNGYITEEFTVISQYNKHLADARQHEISCENIMKQMAYPSIVGSMLNIPIVNYGITASSQDRILYEFTPWFFNMFTNIDNMNNILWDIIPDESWLIPKNANVVSQLFGGDNNVWEHEGNLFDWIMTENDAVKKYIRPCKAHPNLEGHQKIAEYIASELKNRKNLLRDK